MSSDYDFEMTTNDTLELDTIVKESDIASDPITKVKNMDTNTDYTNNLNNIETHTSIFNPTESGEYEIEINGQILLINVTDSSFIPDNGVARYTFDSSDTSDSDSVDVWGGFDATINGATTGASGPNVTYGPLEAYNFDGNNDDVVSPSLPISDATELSLSLWVNLDDTGTQYLMQFGNNDDDIAIVHNNTGGFITFEKIDGSYNDTPDSNIGTKGTWYHLVATFVSNGDIKLYIDASLEGSGTMANSVTELPNTVLHIGSRDSSSRFVGGSISDVRVYDKELTQTEVSNLYNGGSIA